MNKNYTMEFNNGSVLPENLTSEMNTVDYSEELIRDLVPDWTRYVMAVYVVTAVIIGVPGNSLVLLVLLKLKKKTSTDWFVIFIAFCDVIALLFHGPLLLNVTLDLWKIVHTQFLCKFDFYVIHFAFLQSSLLITCVGVDRYVKTCKPHSVFFTPKSALACCFTIVLVSALLSISHFFTSKVTLDGDCTSDTSKATIIMLLYIVRFLTFSICSVALCVMYSKIAIRIRNRMKVGVTQSMVYNNDQNLKIHKGCLVHCFSNRKTGVGISVQPVNVNQTLDKNAGTKTSGVADAYIKTEKRSSASSEQGIFNVSASKTGKVHQVTHGFNEGANTSTNSVAQIIKTVQFTAIRQHDKQIKQINKTTKTMGVITLVFIISSVVPTITAALLPVSRDLKENPIMRVVVYFLLRLYIISFFANPLFYIWLSSNFRKKIMEILKVCKK